MRMGAGPRDGKKWRQKCSAFRSKLYSADLFINFYVLKSFTGLQGKLSMTLFLCILNLSRYAHGWQAGCNSIVGNQDAAFYLLTFQIEKICHADEEPSPCL